MASPHGRFLEAFGALAILERVCQRHGEACPRRDGAATGPELASRHLGAALPASAHAVGTAHSAGAGAAGRDWYSGPTHEVGAARYRPNWYSRGAGRGGPKACQKVKP